MHVCMYIYVYVCLNVCMHIYYIHLYTPSLIHCFVRHVVRAGVHHPDLLHYQRSRAVDLQEPRRGLGEDGARGQAPGDRLPQERRSALLRPAHQSTAIR